MDESTTLRQKFEELRERAASSDAELLQVLVDAREGGLVSKSLDERINQLRDGEVDPEVVIAWVEAMADGSATNGEGNALSAESDPSSVELDPDSGPIDFALVGESKTADAGDSESEDGLDRVVVDLESAPEGDAPAKGEDDLDMGLFDDIGDMMAEAGKKALDEAREFKLPKLTSSKKLPLSGDARKKLSKRFSVPNPTRDVPPLNKLQAASAAAAPDEGANPTPYVGLDAIQGVVANSAKAGAVPDEPVVVPDEVAPEPEESATADAAGAQAPSDDAGDDFGFGDFDMDALVASATDGADAALAASKEEAPGEVSAGSEEEEPQSAELVLDSEADSDDDSELEADDLGLDFGFLDSEVESDDDSVSEVDDADDEGLDFGLLDSEPSEAAPESPQGLDFGFDDDSEVAEAGSAAPSGGGSGMGSLFDDDELAEIEDAGKPSGSTRNPKPSDGSTPGIRYDSGKSGARYAGTAPPPPTHRLRGGDSNGPAMTGFAFEDDEEEEDDFDLDFGMGGAQSASGFGSGAADAESSEPTDDEDDFEFDLGLSNPEESQQSTPGVAIGQESSASSDDDFEFDLGFDTPVEQDSTPPAGSGFSEGSFDLEFDDSSVAMELDEDSRGVTKGPPGFSVDGPSKDGSSTEEREDYDQLRRQAVRSDVVGSDSNEREYQPTPMRHDAIQRPARGQQPTPMARERIGGGAAEIDEEEFDALYDSFEEPRQYRGEPLVSDSSEVSDAEEIEARDGGDNPFAHEAPTGVRHAAVESSFVLEEISGVEDSAGTNLSAILLEARRLYENGEFDQSMDIVQKVLSREPGSDDALELKLAIEGELERFEMEKLGSLSKVPRLKVAMSEIASIDLDHRAGFLLSQIDGFMAFEDLLELSSMSRYETLSVLTDLMDKDVIEVD